jgi:hypothetical protein
MYVGVMTWLCWARSCKKRLSNDLSGRKSRVRTELRRSSGTLFERVKKRWVLAIQIISKIREDEVAHTKWGSSLSRYLDRVTPELCHED